MKPGRPMAEIDIDGRALRADESALVRLTVESAIGCHDRVAMSFWPRSKFAGAKPGAKVKVRLGTEEDGDHAVCAGAIGSARQMPDGVSLEAYAPTLALSRARTSQTYLSQSVGDIVRDLAGAVEVDEIESDVVLESYAVDARRSVWGHLLDLARLAGADVGCAPEGGLRFVTIRAGSATRTYRYQSDVLHWDVAAATAADPPEIAPHGAASEAGKAKWHWILHDPSGASGKPARVIAGFQTRDAADNLAAALADRASRAAARGALVVVGDAEVRAGAVIQVEDAPGFDPGPLRVIAVRHRFDAEAGFRTTLSVEGAGGGGGFPL